MRIERLRIEQTAAGRRAMADVTWENYEHAPQSLIIEAADPFASELEPSPDAFLVALLPIAQWRGEARVYVEGSVCTRLRDGLAAALAHFGLFHARCRNVKIEPSGGFKPTSPIAAPRAASFLSGGIDAIALLRANRLEYPSHHPAFIRDCFLIFGMNTYDIGPSGEDPARRHVFEQHTRRMMTFAENAGGSLIPIDTNVRTFYPDWDSWLEVGSSAGTISTALCFPGRISRVEIASGGIGIRIPPHGSHPWLDSNYSTEAVSVIYGQPALSRIEKTRIVSEWPEGLSVLRSCLYRSIPTNGRINCGECEKCLRTMLALLAFGRLDQAPTFPFDDVTVSMVDSLYMEDENDCAFLMQCVDGLRTQNRLDLVNAIDRKIAEYRRLVRRRNALNMVKRATGLAKPEPKRPVSAWLDS